VVVFRPHRERTDDEEAAAGANLRTGSLLPRLTCSLHLVDGRLEVKADAESWALPDLD
jgi:hypothetical protein